MMMPPVVAVVPVMAVFTIVPIVGTVPFPITVLRFRCGQRRALPVAKPLLSLRTKPLLIFWIIPRPISVTNGAVASCYAVPGRRAHSPLHRSVLVGCLLSRSIELARSNLAVLDISALMD